MDVRFCQPVPFQNVTLSLPILKVKMVVSQHMAGKIEALHDEGLPIRTITDRLGLARNTIRRVLRNKELYRSSARRKRATRAAVTQRREALRKLALRNRRRKVKGVFVDVERMYPTIPKLAERISEDFGPVSRAAISRDLTALGLGMRARPRVVNNCPEANAKRLAFAIRHLKTRLSRYIFSDECWVNNNDNTHAKEVCDLNDPDSRPTCRVHQKRPSVKVMIWGAVGLNFKSELIVLTRSVSADVYISDVLEVVRPQLVGRKSMLFMQDNAKPHTAGVSTEWFENNGIPLLQGWPPHSPHMNPIEHIWALIHKKIAVLRPQTVEELAKVAREVWDSLTQEQVNDFVRGYTSALAKCILLKGKPW